jgi:hypothetical protein
MLDHAVEYYKTLFGREQKENIRMADDFWEEDVKVSAAENSVLEAEFFEEEIKKAIDGSYAEGATGPDDFSFLFYQKFWVVIKDDLMAVVRGFEKGEVNIARLNYVVITLIPQEQEAGSLKKFSPISLINCNFNIFAKALTNRLETICDRLLAPN